MLLHWVKIHNHHLYPFSGPTWKLTCAIIHIEKCCQVTTEQVPHCHFFFWLTINYIISKTRLCKNFLLVLSSSTSYLHICFIYLCFFHLVYKPLFAEPGEEHSFTPFFCLALLKQWICLLGWEKEGIYLSPQPACRQEVDEDGQRVGPDSLSIGNVWLEGGELSCFLKRDKITYPWEAGALWYSIYFLILSCESVATCPHLYKVGCNVTK